MNPLKVLKISYYSSNRCYAVVLKEIEGDNCLPVIIGAFEAQSIALAIEVLETPRPSTHDLICDFIKKSDSNLKAIKINDLQDGVYYSTIEIESKNSNNIVIDSRPSDAIAIALRLNAPILVNPEILLEAGVPESSLTEENLKERNKDVSIIELKEKLKIAIDQEDYEDAAKLRDKISNLES